MRFLEGLETIYRLAESPHLFTRLEERITSGKHRLARVEGLASKIWAERTYLFLRSQQQTPESRRRTRKEKSLSAKYRIISRRI